MATGAGAADGAASDGGGGVVAPLTDVGVGEGEDSFLDRFNGCWWAEAAADAAAAAALVIPTCRLTTFGDGVRRMTDTEDAAGGGEPEDDEGDRTRANTPAAAYRLHGWATGDGDSRLFWANADVITGVCCHLLVGCGCCCCWYDASSRMMKLCMTSVRLICSAVILGVSRNDLANVECVLDSDDEVR